MARAAKILIVDDEEVLRNLISDDLQSHGYDMHEAGSGSEALEYLAANATDVVILDIKMPGMGGLEVLEKIREGGLARKVIMLTGVGELKMARESLELGANDFMFKPFEMPHLLACINRVLTE